MVRMDPNRIPPRLSDAINEAIAANERYLADSARFETPEVPLSPGTLYTHPDLTGRFPVLLVVSRVDHDGVVFLPVLRGRTRRALTEAVIAPSDSPLSLSPWSGHLLIVRWLPIRPDAAALESMTPLSRVPVVPALLEVSVPPTRGRRPDLVRRLQRAGLLESNRR